MVIWGLTVSSVSEWVVTLTLLWAKVLVTVSRWTWVEVSWRWIDRWVDLVELEVKMVQQGEPWFLLRF